jgi:hypothetical protein
MAEPLYDVIEVQIAAPNDERVMAERLTDKNARAFVAMAIARRGLETHFYVQRERKASPHD